MTHKRTDRLRTMSRRHAVYRTLAQGWKISSGGTRGLWFPIYPATSKETGAYKTMMDLLTTGALIGAVVAAVNGSVFWTVVLVVISQVFNWASERSAKP